MNYQKLINNAAVNCRTKEEAQTLISLTNSPTRFLKYWEIHYKGNTCYRFGKDNVVAHFGSDEWYDCQNIKIISFQEFLQLYNKQQEWEERQKQADLAETFGRLIDVVEDWLESKGITPEEITNNERDEGNPAIIYGSDYDFLVDKFSEALGISSDVSQIDSGNHNKVQINRLIDGQIHTFTLTPNEISAAHESFVIAWMESEIKNIDSEIPEIDVVAISRRAYDIYCEGDGHTEYESLEKAIEEYKSEQQTFCM